MILIRRRIVHQIVTLTAITPAFDALGLETLIEGTQGRIYAIYRTPANPTTNLATDIRTILDTPMATITAGMPSTTTATTHTATPTSRTSSTSLRIGA